ncbi:MAG: phage holin family protein [Vitreoscilla sp.]|nr:phage holin family protein [Vitreoscilla sp.]
MSGQEKSQISLLKEMLGNVVELLLVRLQMARVDILDLKNTLIKVLLSTVAALILFLLGFICLLFGLNAVLSPLAKIWVFFGLAVLSLLVIGLLVMNALSALKGQQACLQSTLKGLQDDVAYIRGDKRYSDIEIKELDDDSR